MIRPCPAPGRYAEWHGRARGLCQRKILLQLHDGGPTLNCNRKHCSMSVVCGAHYLTFSRQINRMNSLFSLDTYDEGYRCMHRNHCSTLHQEPADTNVLADSFDFDGGVASLKF